MSVETSLPMLRKHVSAIHIGAKDYGLMHRKCVNAALYLAREMVKIDYNGDIERFLSETADREVNHHVSLRDFKTLINYNSNDNEYLKNVLTKLVTTPVEFDILGSNSKDDSWEVMALLSHAKVQDSVVSFRFPSEIRSQLINPTVYAQLSLDIQNQFDGEHALSLYENTYRYQRIGKTPKIKVTDFKRLMGIDADAYKEFKYLNDKVIKKSIKEVNKVSNISLDVEFFKLGRKVHALQFFISRKQERDMFIDEDVVGHEDAELQLRLKGLGLHDKQISAFFDKFDIGYLSSKVQWLESKVQQDSSIQNLAAFAYNAINEGYEQPSKSTVTKPSESSSAKIESDVKTQDLVKRYGNRSNKE